MVGKNCDNEDYKMSYCDEMSVKETDLYMYEVDVE